MAELINNIIKGIKLEEVYVGLEADRSELITTPQGETVLVTKGDYYDPETGAHLERDVFAGIADRLRQGGFGTIDTMAVELSGMARISTEEAKRRIQLELDRPADLKKIVA